MPSASGRRYHLLLGILVAALAALTDVTCPIGPYPALGDASPASLIDGIGPRLSCPEACVCKWKNGKETVECVNASLTAIPPIDRATQVLDLTLNYLPVLPRDIFLTLNLPNLQKVFMAKCSLREVGRHAFRGLTNLVELDLSFNAMEVIPSFSEQDCIYLMKLNLKGNPLLTKISGGAFANLKDLNSLDLSDCGLTQIEENAFKGLENLAYLRLENNRLKYIAHQTFFPDKLRDLTVHNNRWHCDCDLLGFRLWLLNFIRGSSAAGRIGGNGGDARCHTPARLINEPIAGLPVDKFACLPEISPSAVYLEVIEGKNVTLVCNVKAVPNALVRWTFRGQPILNGSTMASNNIRISETLSHQPLREDIITMNSDLEVEQLGGTLYFHNKRQKNSSSSVPYYFLETDLGGFTKRSALYLTGATIADNGTFGCSAGNDAGEAAAKFALHVVVPMPPKPPQDVVEERFDTEYVIAIAIASVMTALISGVAVALTALRCKRDRDKALRRRSSSHSTNSRRRSQESGNMQLRLSGDTQPIAQQQQQNNGGILKNGRSSGNSLENVFNGENPSLVVKSKSGGDFSISSESVATQMTASSIPGSVTSNSYHHPQQQYPQNRQQQPRHNQQNQYATNSLIQLEEMQNSYHHLSASQTSFIDLTASAGANGPQVMATTPDLVKSIPRFHEHLMRKNSKGSPPPPPIRGQSLDSTTTNSSRVSPPPPPSLSPPMAFADDSILPSSASMNFSTSIQVITSPNKKSKRKSQNLNLEHQKSSDHHQYHLHDSKCRTLPRKTSNNAQQLHQIHQNGSQQHQNQATCTTLKLQTKKTKSGKSLNKGQINPDSFLLPPPPQYKGVHFAEKTAADPPIPTEGLPKGPAKQRPSLSNKGQPNSKAGGLNNGSVVMAETVPILIKNPGNKTAALIKKNEGGQKFPTSSSMTFNKGQQPKLTSDTNQESNKPIEVAIVHHSCSNPTTSPKRILSNGKITLANSNIQNSNNIPKTAVVNSEKEVSQQQIEEEAKASTAKSSSIQL